jgi:hypothetical protein
MISVIIIVMRSSGSFNQDFFKIHFNILFLTITHSKLALTLASLRNKTINGNFSNYVMNELFSLIFKWIHSEATHWLSTEKYFQRNYLLMKLQLSLSLRTDSFCQPFTQMLFVVCWISSRQRVLFFFVINFHKEKHFMGHKNLSTSIIIET